MSVELRTVLEDESSLIEDAGKALLDGDAESLTASLAGVAVGIATASPTLGALASRGVAKIFGETATKRLQKAMREQDSEDQREAIVGRLTSHIEAMLGEFLLQIVKNQRAVTEEMVISLGGNPELRDFADDAASRLDSFALQIDVLDVRDGAIGVEVSPSGRQAFVKSMSVAGRGSVGVKL